MNFATSSIIPCLINDRNYQVTKGSTVLQACEQSGLLIPRFCYHDRLSIAGNCRMCLVQLDKVAKPVASCALEVLPNMKIYTNTSTVKKAREGVMEFLLANHPLDCPICDQGGECDLQDQALVFGNDRGRFYEAKRSVSDKDWGHLVKTVMTRCIHCTRCQRFSSELSGQVEIAMVGRGGKSEITNFLGNLVRSEVSGNVIDLCPVGALTSKPYAFSARPWELSRLEAIDLTDSLGSNLSFQVMNQRILRVLPVLHQKLNEEWLSNRARFAYDGFRLQRLTAPTFSDGVGLSSLTWSQAFSSFLFSIGPFFSFSLFSAESSLQSSFLLKQLSSFSPLEEGVSNTDHRHSFIMNTPYSSLSDSDLVVIAGSNLRRELPLLLVRLRLEQTKRDLNILVFGSSEFGLSVTQVGVTLDHLLFFLQGRHVCSPLLKRSKKPAILLASSFSESVLLASLQQFAMRANKSVVLGVVPSADTSFLNFSEVGLPNLSLQAERFTDFLINSTPVVGNSIDAKSTVYVGSYGFDWLIRPNLLLLPITNYPEDVGYHINLEGRLQLSRRVLVNSSLKSLEVLFTFLMSLLSLSKSKQTLGAAVNLVVNLTPVVSLIVERTLFFQTASTVFSSPSCSVYQTIPVTYVSPLLLKSSQVDRSHRTSAFPLL